MTWTLTEIRATIRNVTGKQDTSQATEDAVLDKINQYYQHILPQEISPPELRGWCTTLTPSGGSLGSVTVDGTKEYTLPSTVASVYAPAYVNDDRITLYTDKGEFYDDYPHDSTDESQPEAALVNGTTIIFGQIPDDAYSFRFSCWNKPTALGGSNTTPLNQKWGPLIAYGAAVAMMQEAGEFRETSDLAGMYEFYKLNAIRDKLLAIPTGQRSRPRF